MNKLKRGKASTKFIFNQESLKKFFDKYFNICDKTEEKLKFLMMLSILVLNIICLFYIVFFV